MRDWLRQECYWHNEKSFWKGKWMNKLIISPGPWTWCWLRSAIKGTWLWWKFVSLWENGGEKRVWEVNKTSGIFPGVWRSLRNKSVFRICCYARHWDQGMLEKHEQVGRAHRLWGGWQEGIEAGKLRWHSVCYKVLQYQAYRVTGSFM